MDYIRRIGDGQGNYRREKSIFKKCFEALFSLFLTN